MEPEKIDELFRKKMETFQRTPSADAWTRLQSRIEPPKKEEKKVMWLYYVAASVMLVLVSGVLWLANRNEPETGTQLATTLKTEQKAPGQQQTEITETAIAANHPEQNAAKKADIINTPAESGKAVKGTVETRQLAVVKQTEKAGRKNKANQPVLEKAAAPETLLANRQPKQKTETGKYSGTALAANKPGTGAEKAGMTEAGEAGQKQSLEILIIRDNQPAEAVAVAAEPVLPEEQEVNKPTKLQIAKNIGKQLLNLKRGEKIDRTELGLQENYHIAFETQIGKQKISKSINL